MKKVLEEMISKESIKLFCFILFFPLLSQGQKLQDDERIDSIHYSKDDAFFNYTILDIFLNKSGDLFKNELGKDVYLSRNRETQIGSLRKTNISSEIIDSIFLNIENLDFSILKDSYSTSRSDQSTAYLSFYSSGKLIKSISDYGMQGTIELISFYRHLESLKNCNCNWVDWSGDFLLSTSLVDNNKVDSIQLITHLKSEGKYFRNGIKREYVLKGEELGDFLKDGLEFVPRISYHNPKYEILTFRADKYSIVIYYNNGAIEWIKFDGNRIMKKSYLFFVSKKNLIKKYFRRKN